MKPAIDEVHRYMSEVSCRLVADTRIPSDRHHLGKLILHCLKEDPQFVMQIDGATGDSETNGSAADRSIRCALSLTDMGLKKGDVMVLMGPNHLEFCVPHNAGLYLGIMVACIDATLGPNELQVLFLVNVPKIIFCQSEKTADVERALALSKVNAKIVTFDEDSNYTTLTQLLENKDEEAIKNFRPTDFDPEDTVAYLTSTSGTTGVPKTAMLTHKNLAIALPYLWSRFTEFPTPTRLAMVLSPAQWLSAGFHYLFSPVLKYTRLQSSLPIATEHFAELVTKYKPTYTLCSPTMMTTLAANARCDFSCFECILLGGSVVSQELINQMKKLAQTNNVFIIYGMSEICGAVNYSDSSTPVGSCGTLIGGLAYRLVNPETNEDITEPNVSGELWFKGPMVFKGYHNNPDVTSEALTHDGWLKSGDIFYRDESWNMFYVERYKLLLKYKSHQRRR